MSDCGNFLVTCVLRKKKAIVPKTRINSERRRKSETPIKKSRSVSLLNQNSTRLQLMKEYGRCRSQSKKRVNNFDRTKKRGGLNLAEKEKKK